jgi:hypothetical protein
VPAAQKIYSPYVERTVQDQNFAEGLYWGDTHLHTRYSSDSLISLPFKFNEKNSCFASLAMMC